MKSRNHLAKLLAISLLSLGSLSSVVNGAQTTFNVDSNADTPDATPNDAICGQVIPPSTTATAGTCTLRAAIAAANFNVGVDTIDMTGLGAQSRSITLTSDLPTLTEPVEIRATVATGALVTINGNGRFVALQFTPPPPGADRSAGNSSITGLTITAALNAAAGGGGAIFFGPSFPSRLTLNSVVLDGNSAGTASPGGAIAVSDGNALVVNAGSFTGNSALRGGAIAVLSDVNSPAGNVLTLSGVTVTGNSATSNGGAVLADLRNGGDVLVDGGTFGGAAVVARNSATGDGGAFWIRKDVVGGSVVIRRTHIINNAAANGAGVAVKNGRIQLRDSTLSANAATAAGGGVYLDADVVNVNGGSAHLENLTFSSNSAAAQGGAIAANAGNAATSTMIYSTLADNTAATGMGGGISVATAPNLSFPGSFTDPFTSNLFANSNNCRIAFSHADSRNSGYQIASDASCGFTQASDRQMTNAQLGALAVNGPAGTVPTRNLAATSPAIDTGNPSWANARDARDADRQDAGIDGDYSNNSPGLRDIGAHEFGGFGIVEFRFAAPATGYSVEEDATPAQAFIARYGTGSAASSAPSVSLASSNGTAIAGSDYTALVAPDTTVSFANGITTDVVRNLAITNDATSEEAETFNLALSAPTAFADLGPRAAATVTINDAENGTFQFNPLTASATESVGGANMANGSAVLTITRSIGSKGRVKLGYVTAADTVCTPAATCRATAADDYTAVSDGSVIFETGETSKTIAIELVNNSIAETAERFLVNLTSVACVDATGAVITGSACDALLTPTTANRTNTVTINDDEGAASFSIADVMLAEGNTGSKAFVFTLTLTPASNQAATVSAASANGTATIADTDYTALAVTTLTFAAGETSKTVTVNVTGDVRFEPDETFVVNLTSPTGGAVIADNQATGTIINDEATPAQGSIGFVADCATEAGKCATQSGTEATALQSRTFAIRRSDQNDTASTVSASITLTSPNSYSTVGTATCSATGNDYRLSGTGGGGAPNATTITLNANGTGTVTFNGNGVAEALISVEICNDTRRESLQLLDLALSNATGGAVLGTSAARLTTTSDEQPRYQMTRTAFSVREGSDLFAVFNVQALDAVDGEQVCVPYKTADGPTVGGATSPADYSGVDRSADPCSGALVYPNGNNAAKSFSAMIVDDGLAPAENNETFSASLLTPVGGGTAVPGGETTTVTIVNQPRVYFSTHTFNSSDEADGSEFVLTLVRDGDSSSASTVQYRIDTGTGSGMASFDTDFTHGSPSSQTGAITFAVGMTTASIRTRLIGDSSIEGDERFTITLTSSDDASFPPDSAATPRTATGVITDDDFRFEFAAASSAMDEGVMGGNAVITVNRVGRSVAASSVSFALVAGTATEGSDYNAPASLSVDFPAGEGGSQTINVPLNDDALDEVDEGFTVDLTAAASPGTLGSPTSHVLTITDNDDAPTLSVADVSLTEGDMGAAPLRFTVTLSAASAKAVMVTATTADGSATAGSDYDSNTQMLMIPAGQISVSFDVSVNGDVLFEGNEQFTLNLSNPSNATLADGSAIGIITNNDAMPSLSVADTSVIEGNTGSRNLSFVVRLSQASAQPVTVAFATVNGTATAGSDYTSTSGTLTFTAGETSKTVSVPVAGDTTSEPSETLLLNLSGATGATLADGNATGTITNDDAAPTLSIADTSVTEGSDQAITTMRFTVSLSGASSVDVTVNYATANGSATADADYTATNGTLMIPAGQTSASFTVPVTADGIDESNEVFTATLSNGSVQISRAQATGAITDDDTAPSSASAADGQGRTLGFNTTAGGFEGLSSTTQPGNAPTNLVYDNGFFGYTVAGLATGGSATVTITLPAGSSATSYVNCPSECITGGSGNAQTVSMTLVDGGPGDADGVANGRIVVRAGAGGRAPSQGVPGTGGGGGGSFGVMSLFGLAALLGLRRRRFA